MKKVLFMVFILGFLFSGCSGTVSESEFMNHGSHYRNFDHLKYSWFGFKEPTPETGEKSDNQQWWGIPVEVEK